MATARTSTASGEDIVAWTRQLYWREFSWHLPHHREHLENTPVRPASAEFPYYPDDHLAWVWRQGHTGVDLVDAGVRQLWQTGWTHNRVRTVAASLPTRNMFRLWQDGKQWFWKTLVDADEVNNPVSWQWVAGCGADTMPYFHIFNPDLQRTRFDPYSRYVRRWIPEGFARPVVSAVNLTGSRREALAAYEQVRGLSDSLAKSQRG